MVQRLRLAKLKVLIRKYPGLSILSMLFDPYKKDHKKRQHSRIDILEFDQKKKDQKWTTDRPQIFVD